MLRIKIAIYRHDMDSMIHHYKSTSEHYAAVLLD